MRINIFLIIFTYLCASTAHAEIYTCKDANGETIFTDSPAQCANAEEVKVDKLPTLTPSKSIPIPASRTSKKVDEDANVYQEIVITSPKNDSITRNNQGDLTINYRSSPGLQSGKGHKYLVTINGKEVYRGTSTIASLKNVDRGTLSIVASIITSEDKIILSSSPVSFTLQRVSLQQNIASSDSSGDSDADGDSGSDSDSDSSSDPDDPEPTINQNNFNFPGKLPRRP